MSKPSIIEAMEHPKLFGPWFQGPSWDGWKSILKAAYALEMTAEEVEFFRTVAARDPPKKRVKEVWLCCGRRAGKDSIASLVAAYESYFFEGGKSLRPGERALVACFGNDKEQAKIELDYVRSYYRARTSRMDPTATLVAAFFRVQKDAFVHASLPDKLRPRQ